MFSQKNYTCFAFLVNCVFLPSNIFMYVYEFIIFRLSLNATQPEFFSNLDEHVDSNLASHKVAMVKKIVTIYVSLRLKHFCREKNNNVSNKMIRTKLTKLILFQGQ